MDICRELISFSSHTFFPLLSAPTFALRHGVHVYENCNTRRLSLAKNREKIDESSENEFAYEYECLWNFEHVKM